MTAARSSSAPDAQSIARDPEWLPADIDAEKRQITFLHVPRPLHAKVPFLSREYLAASAPAEIMLSEEPLVRALSQANDAPHFIFHSAFCCSTLLARTLDQRGVAMGLKEPEILNHLAGLARQGKLVPQQLNLVVRLLGRPFGAGEKVVVKPSNVANVVIDELMRASPGSRALLLHAPLARFLGSIARQGLWGRGWARRLYLRLAHDFGSPFGYSQSELFEQTDLQVAALAWLLHQRQFAELARRMPERIRTLDSISFLANRERALTALAAMFGLVLDSARVAAIVSGPIFSMDAKKSDEAFEERSGAPPETRGQDEIDLVCKWAAAVAAHADIPLELPTETRLLA